MRLVYLSIGEPTRGVKNKLLDKVYSLNRLGAQATLLSIYFGDRSEKVNQSEVHTLVMVDHGALKRVARLPIFWRLEALVTQWKLYKALAVELRMAGVDFFIMRYPGADVFFWWYLKGLKKKVVFEHNTLELEELKLRKSKSFYYRYSYWNELLFGTVIRKWAAGAVAVTQEIETYEQTRGMHSTPSCVISNGIVVDRIPMRTGPPYDGAPLNLLLLAGSESPWHGVQYLLHFLQRPESESIHAYVVGSVSEDLKQWIATLSNVTWLPTKTGADLDELVNRCHIGVSGLDFTGLLTQACTLKVREYWARGLPFLLSHHDVDVADTAAMSPFYYQVNLKDGATTLRDVVNFARQVYRIENVPKKMRELARQKIDYDVKSVELFKFLKALKK